MAVRKALILVGGELSELPDGDTIEGASSATGNGYDLSSSDLNSTHTFNAWHRSTDDTWHAVRYALATGLLDGSATGAGAIPADLKILTYS